MKAKALRELIGVAGAKKDRDLAALEAVLAKLGTLDAEIAELAATHARDMAEAAGAGVPMMAIGRRLAWADAEIRRRRAEREGLIGEIEAARAAARVSVAKHAAVEKLAEKAEALERTERERRAEDQAAAGGARLPEDEDPED